MFLTAAVSPLSESEWLGEAGKSVIIFAYSSGVSCVIINTCEPWREGIRAEQIIMAGQILAPAHLMLLFGTSPLRICKELADIKSLLLPVRARGSVQGGGQRC